MRLYLQVVVGFDVNSLVHCTPRMDLELQSTITFMENSGQICSVVICNLYAPNNSPASFIMSYILKELASILKGLLPAPIKNASAKPCSIDCDRKVHSSFVSSASAGDSDEYNHFTPHLLCLFAYMLQLDTQASWKHFTDKSHGILWTATLHKNKFCKGFVKKLTKEWLLQTVWGRNTHPWRRGECRQVRHTVH